MQSLTILRTALTADTGLGRFDLYSVSDQELMELLADGFDKITQCQLTGEDGEYLLVTSWDFVRCNRKGDVVEMRFPALVSPWHRDNRQLRYSKAGITGGIFETKYVPRQTASLTMKQASFHGTFDAAALCGE